MASNANSVNIASSRSGYHHGDLRTALIEQGLQLLELRSVDTLSLREVARGAGVSAPAVYRHFPDKAALLRALAREGLVRLAAEQAEAAVRSASNGFAASGAAYVRFALANPALFRLIFTSGPGPASLADEPEGSAGHQLHQHVIAALGDRADERAARIIAYRAWSLVHGLAMLMLDRQIDPRLAGPLIDDVINGMEI